LLCFTAKHKPSGGRGTCPLSRPHRMQSRDASASRTALVLRAIDAASAPEHKGLQSSTAHAAGLSSPPIDRQGVLVSPRLVLCSAVVPKRGAPIADPLDEHLNHLAPQPIPGAPP